MCIDIVPSQMKTHRYFLIAILLLSCSVSFSQKIKFDVFLLGNKIGETIVECRDSAGLKIYTLRSHTDAKVLFVERTSAMSTDARYTKDGKLFSSSCQSMKSDERFFTTTVRDGATRYLINKDGVKTVVTTPITYSSIMLYFIEPANMQKVFSERLGGFFQMARQPDSTYLTYVEEHYANYTYKGGKLMELEIKSALGSIVIKRAL